MTTSPPLQVESQPATHSTGIFASMKRLGLNSGIYALGNLLTRGLVFLLVPVLTRVLTPAEYGILAITTTVGNLLAMVFSCGIDGVVTRMYFKYNSEKERRNLYGTLLVFWLIVPTSCALILDVLGRAGCLDFYPGVPFHPYLQITIWTSCFSIFIGLPQAIYITLQKPLKVMRLTITSALATVGLSIYLVVYLHQGIMGSLRATFISAGLMAVIAIILMARLASWEFSWNKLKAALKFSLPIVPHTMSQWVLSVSDRLILGCYVSAGSLGLYSLGYQFGALVVLFSGSIMNAFTPLITAQLIDEHSRDKVPLLGTYVLLSITIIGLGLALFGEDLIRFLTPLQFHSAQKVVPLVVLGYVFHGVYLVWSCGTWFSMRTTWMSFLTILAGAINIGLNFWLIPRWGIMAAAFNTAVAYGVLALLHGYLAEKLYPIAWEYKRWAKMLVVGSGCYIIAKALSSDDMALNFVLKSGVLFIIFPVSLFLLRFLTPAERQFAFLLPGRLRRGLR